MANFFEDQVTNCLPSFKGFWRSFSNANIIRGSRLLNNIPFFVVQNERQLCTSGYSKFDDDEFAKQVVEPIRIVPFGRLPHEIFGYQANDSKTSFEDQFIKCLPSFKDCCS